MILVAPLASGTDRRNATRVSTALLSVLMVRRRWRTVAAMDRQRRGSGRARAAVAAAGWRPTSATDNRPVSPSTLSHSTMRTVQLHSRHMIDYSEALFACNRLRSQSDRRFSLVAAPDTRISCDASRVTCATNITKRYFRFSFFSHRICIREKQETSL